MNAKKMLTGVYCLCLSIPVLGSTLSINPDERYFEQPEYRSFDWWPFDIRPPYGLVPDPHKASVIRLTVGEFDTELGEIVIPDGLRAHDLAVGESGYYIVQFNGPVSESDKNLIINRGIELHDYIPNYAFVARMPRSQSTSLEFISSIRWIDRYHPAYKIDPLTGNQPFKEIQRLSESDFTLIVSVFHRKSLPDVAERVMDLGGSVLDIVSTPHRSSLVIRLHYSAICELAICEEVKWIEEKPETYALNDETQEVLQSGSVAGGTPVWNHGIHGEDQIIGHMDTGVDVDHCFFYDPTQPFPGPVPNYFHRKVVAYRTYAEGRVYDGCTNGHGSHTAGTAAGWTSNPSGAAYIGLAYQAKLTVNDVGKDDWTTCLLGMLTIPASLTVPFQDTYNDGARIHTNSWGSTSNTYDSMCVDSDGFMWDNKDFLILYAAGNSGPSYGTVGSPATSKNIVCVGGSNNEPDQEQMYNNSSRGPVNGSNRMAPMVLAPATDGGFLGGIDSAASDGDTTGETCGITGPGYQGTSMACPAAAASAALIRQYYTYGYYPSGNPVPGNAFTPSAALVKATMINGVHNMSGPPDRPNNDQGWGRILLDNCLYFSGDLAKVIVRDDVTGLCTGESTDVTFRVNYPSTPLRVTLVWTDRPDNFLTNDLDLELHCGSTRWFGNNFSGGWSNFETTRDRSLPTECIFLDAGNYPTGNYTVTVTGFNIPSGEPGGLQPYALVITGDISEFSGPTPTPPPTSTVPYTSTPFPTFTPPPGTTYTPAPTGTPPPGSTHTPIPSFTPFNSPTPSASPLCDRLGVTIDMPSHMYRPGDPCFLNISICNPDAWSLPDTPLFVILDVYGSCFFAPGWTETLDYFTLTVMPGRAIFTVLEQFSWPPDTGNADGLTFYSAMTDPAFKRILGMYDTWGFGWASY